MFPGPLVPGAAQMRAGHHHHRREANAPRAILLSDTRDVGRGTRPPEATGGPWSKRLHTVVDVARAVFDESRADRVTGLAAEVAFFGVLSIFPALLAIAAAVGWLESLLGQDVAARAQREVIGLLEQVLTEEASGAVDTARDLFERESPGVLTIGLLGALWAMSRGLAAVIRALHQAYDVEERRSYVRVRLTGLALALGTVLAGAVLLGMFVLGPLFGRGRGVADTIGAGGVFAFLWNVARPPLVFAVLVGWAVVVLHVAPAHDAPWRQALPGAVLAASLWVLLSGGLRLYLEVAAGANEMLGVLGGALIVLIWLYLLSASLLLGAELNGVLAGRTARSASESSTTNPR